MKSLFNPLLNGKNIKLTILTIVASCAHMELSPVFAGSAGAMYKIDMSLMWTVPFAGILLSLALMPILAQNIWHNHYGKITLAWSMGTIVSLFYNLSFSDALTEVTFVYIEHYLPFIILAGSLYVIAGGIHLNIRGAGMPFQNTMLLLVGTLVASWIGTTGAAMVFIRPLIHMNRWRQYKSHTIIFFILLVCNIGGSLSPIGDPPLFLGFLFGVDFFWPTTHMFLPFLIMSSPLLLAYYFLDSKIIQEENLDNYKRIEKDIPKGLVEIQGRRNMLLMIAVVLVVMLSGIWKSDHYIMLFGVKIELQDLVRDILLIAFAIMSITVTSQIPRKINNFSWEPLLEVMKIFAGIFITASPVMAILSMGEKGALSYIVSIVNDNGAPINYMYFWITGFLSSFLDNAPTYMVFFQMAGGDAQQLMGPLANTLLAISAGSVFMGAMTYIGNAPNFMVRAIAESKMIQMPSFFKYMLYSTILLLPPMIIVTFVFFV